MNDRIVIESGTPGLNRRQLLKTAMGLTLAWYLPDALSASATSSSGAVEFAPNAFLRIGTDNMVTVISKHLEMGQGTYTGLATIVAEELDADWQQVRVEAAPADAARYANSAWGKAQGTGGSTAMANSWDQLRQAGATARALLIGAAAQRWQVPVGEISVNAGVITHVASGRSARFGELTELAATLPLPAQVTLKNPADFKLIGRHAPRKDAAVKTNGSAIFTQDIQLPGMLVAVVAHPPRFGGKVKSVDATAAKAIKGVVDVVSTPAGVAVLASDTWSAKKGRDALSIEWDDSAAFKRSSAEMAAQFRELAKQPGLPAKQRGDVAAAFAAPAQVFDAAYDFPYLAHAAMEPMNCVVQVGANGCEVWNGEQSQTGDQYALAAVLGLKPAQIKLNMLYAGGSFGRRASARSDYLVEAAQIAKASGRDVPIKLVWLREDDTKGGYYRPQFHHRLRAAVDAKGNLTGWHHTLVGQSIMAGTGNAGGIKNGIDPLSVEGASNLPYAIPNLAVDLHTPADIGVPVLWWRSVGSTHTAFSTEVFLDEIAHALKRDPLEYRLALLKEAPRHRAVLQLAADKAGWNKPLAKGAAGVRRGRGIAVHESFGTAVAQVVEVSVQKDGSYKLDRVVCAVDCGIAINPDNVRAQVEGSIGFALSAAKYGAITLTDGKVDQSNFFDYQTIRINEMPKVEVVILPSTNKPSGIGEPAVPPLAPALVNALAVATGQRVRELPIKTDVLKA